MSVTEKRIRFGLCLHHFCYMVTQYDNLNLLQQPNLQKYISNIDTFWFIEDPVYRPENVKRFLQSLITPVDGYYDLQPIEDNAVERVIMLRSWTTNAGLTLHAIAAAFNACIDYRVDLERYPGIEKVFNALTDFFQSIIAIGTMIWFTDKIDREDAMIVQLAMIGNVIHSVKPFEEGCDYDELYKVITTQKSSSQVWDGFPKVSITDSSPWFDLTKVLRLLLAFEKMIRLCNQLLQANHSKDDPATTVLAMYRQLPYAQACAKTVMSAYIVGWFMQDIIDGNKLKGE